MTRILVLDNYDSFVFNLVQYLGQFGVETIVHRNDTLGADLDRALDEAAVNGVLVSPGPGTPESGGASIDLIRTCARRAMPMLGVCLGHQALSVAFGATVGRAPELLHGKTSNVHHDGTGVLAGLPDPFVATRYHSLATAVETLPAELIVNARTESGVIMGIRHRDLPLHGVQFHPESVLTQGGHLMLGNWLAQCGFAEATSIAPALAAEVEELRLVAQP